jgi:RNA polymerase sigma-70 factor (ECF subfamily)
MRALLPSWTRLGQHQGTFLAGRSVYACVVMIDCSFEECFHEHFPRMVALGESMTGDCGIAHDIAQEAFIRLHDHWDTVREFDQPGSWLRRVMSNLLIDHHRSRSAERRAVERLATSPRRESSEVEPDEWSQLVAGLPARQRLIVTLFYGQDLAIAEISESLDISENTVKSALSKARDTLRARMEPRHAQ